MIAIKQRFGLSNRHYTYLQGPQGGQGKDSQCGNPCHTRHRTGWCCRPPADHTTHTSYILYIARSKSSLSPSARLRTADSSGVLKTGRILKIPEHKTENYILYFQKLINLYVILFSIDPKRTMSECNRDLTTVAAVATC